MNENKLKQFQIVGFLFFLVAFSLYCYSFISEDSETTLDKVQVKNTLESQDQKYSKIIQKFQRKYLLISFIDKRSIGYYYLWWKTDKEKTFVKSKTSEYLLKNSKEILGIESYVIDNIMKVLGKSNFKTELLEESYNLTFKTSNNKIILLTIDRNFGLSFHFRKEDGESHRNKFLEDFFEYIKAVKFLLKKNNVKLDKIPNNNCLEVIKNTLREIENQDEVDKVAITLVSKTLKKE